MQTIITNGIFAHRMLNAPAVVVTTVDGGVAGDFVLQLKGPNTTVRTWWKYPVHCCANGVCRAGGNHLCLIQYFPNLFRQRGHREGLLEESRADCQSAMANRSVGSVATEVEDFHLWKSLPEGFG